MLWADVVPASAPADFRLGSSPIPLSPRMKSSVQISRGIESLFGTRDENIRLIEGGLNVRTRLLNDSLEIEGEETGVARAENILTDYVSLVREGHVFNNGDLNNFLRVVTADSETSLRGLVESGKQRSFGKKVIAPKTMMQRRYVDAIERNDLVFGVGPAGTGKTYLAVAMAVSALMAKRVSRIILTRPAVEAGERLGFLPGTLQEKVDPYLRPLYDALYDMLEAEKIEKLLERNTIEVAPIAFMRGRTLNDSFIIMDEAQNSTPEQMKMILTRQGFNSKMVVTGDPTQIDLPGGLRSGLIEVIDVLRGIDGISFVQFDERDVVRHSLVQKIVKAYERYNEIIGANRQLTLKLNDHSGPEVAPPGPGESSPHPAMNPPAA
jgi:phosphate starvation-inducible protein PhoH and related proteins